MNTAELMARLERHYIAPGPLPGGIFVPECGWNPGPGPSRCDALYVGFTSTSGRILIGHEVKASRADWRTELAKSGKADRWHDQCHAWYVVAPDESVVPPEEVPDGWGLLLADGRTRTRLRVAVKAVRRDVEPSWTAVRSIMARYDTLRAEAIAKGLNEARRQVQEEHAKRDDARAERQIPYEYQKAKQMLDQIEVELGVTIAAYGERTCTPEDFAVALRVAERLRAVTGSNQWRVGIEAARQRIQALDSALAELTETLTMEEPA